jgi:DNA-binding beta-propeller fold protein YncE
MLTYIRRVLIALIIFLSLGTNSFGVDLTTGDRHLLYVALPGSTEHPPYENGLGIVVLDVETRYSFVKRIAAWDVPASAWPEVVTGFAASPVTNTAYIATRGHLGAIDLSTDRMIWSNDYDGMCCERPQVTADGQLVVVGSDKKDFWYVVNAQTGKLMSKIQTPLSQAAHNLNLSPDGRWAFMSPIGKVMSIADMGTLKVEKTITFGNTIRVFVLNHDASKIYANTNELLGFEAADVGSGRVVQHVEAPAGLWKAKWAGLGWDKVPHGTPGHGIALANDETQIWVVDGINNYIRIFANAEGYRFLGSIKMTASPGWITMGLGGRYAYVSSGDVVDVKNWRVVTQLKDEFGRQLGSEKLLDMVFRAGKLQRVANQFGNGVAADREH